MIRDISSGRDLREIFIILVRRVMIMVFIMLIG